MRSNRIVQILIIVFLVKATYGGAFSAVVAAMLFAVHPPLSVPVIWISAYSYPQYSTFSS